MRWALAALTAAAFLTFAFEATAADPPIAEAVGRYYVPFAIGLGALYTVLAVVGFGWVERRSRPAWSIGFVVLQVSVGHAVFGAVPGTGATLLLCVLVAQTVLLVGVWPAAALVALLPLVHVGMDAGAGLRAAAGSLIAGAFTAVITVLYVREQRARAELGEAHARLRAYAGEVEQLAAVRERNRVARDIHDGLGHHLTVVRMQVEAARAVLRSEPDRADDVLAKAGDQASDALDEVRRSVAALREPRALPPLADALAALAAESTAAGIATDVETTGPVRDLDDERREALYRAAQEGLTNVRKHAAATSAGVWLDFAAATVAVEIRDDGCGSVSSGRSGFGLVGLRERAEELGGSLVRRSVPGSGTTLRVEVPG